MSNHQNPENVADSRPDGSVARAIVEYRKGDASDLGEIINAYFARLLTRAKVKLGSFPHTDHEGLVQSALRSCLEGARNGQCPGLKHRDELERLLDTILRRKISHEVRDLTTAAAGGGRVQNEPENGLEAEGREPDPAEEAGCREWLEHMGKKGLLEVARLIREGYRYDEIAEKLGKPQSRARRSITKVHKQTQIFFGLEK